MASFAKQISSLKSANIGSTPSAGGISVGGSSAPSQTPLSAQQQVATPTRDVVTSRTSEQNQLLEELRRVDSEVLPTSFVRKMAAQLVQVQRESGIPTGGFDE